MSEQQTEWRGVGATGRSPVRGSPASVALSRAMLCVDCDRIFEATRDGRCPLCGSAAVAPVGRWVAPMPQTAQPIIR